MSALPMRRSHHTEVKIQFLLNALHQDDARKARFQEAFQKYRNECGCSLGAKALTVTVLVYAGLAFRGAFSNPDAWRIAQALLVGVLLALISSVAGKLTGIAIARMRLRRLYRALVLHAEGRHDRM